MLGKKRHTSSPNGGEFHGDLPDGYEAKNLTFKHQDGPEIQDSQGLEKVDFSPSAWRIISVRL